MLEEIKMDYQNKHNKFRKLKKWMNIWKTFWNKNKLISSENDEYDLFEIKNHFEKNLGDKKYIIESCDAIL